MTFEKALKILITKLGEVRHNKMIRKPMAWAFYETWKVVNEKEKEQVGTARTDNADRMGEKERM